MNDASLSSDHPESSENTVTSSDHASSTPTAETGAEPMQEKKRMQKEQKTAFLDHLIRNIDIMFYCELSVIYYMDCSLPTFLLRALPHWFYFTPKPAIFPLPPIGGRGRPYIGIIFGANIICILLHSLFAPPVAGEATRGYLHGGLLIDFVGQKSPVGRWRLMGLDLLVLCLQLVTLGVTLERRVTKAGDGSAEGTQEEVTADRQDHDAEERGVLREDSDGMEEVELQDIHHTSGRTGGDEDRERDELLEAGANSERENQHPMDPFYSGNNVIVNLRILDTIRTQWHTNSVSVENTDASAASGAQAAAVNTVAGRIMAYRGLREGMQGSA